MPETGMPQSLSLVIVHLVFSTKDREPWIPPEMMPRLHAYLAEVARGLGCHAHRVGGAADHVHLALTLPRTVTQSDLVKELKTASNHWLGNRTPGMRILAGSGGMGFFPWGSRNWWPWSSILKTRKPITGGGRFRRSSGMCCRDMRCRGMRRMCGIDGGSGGGC